MTEPARPDLTAEMDRISRLAAIPRPPEPEVDPDSERMFEALRRAGTWAMPSRFTHATLDHFDGTPGTFCPKVADWSTNPRGRNLVLHGPVGVGKSHAGIAACRAAHFERGQDIMFKPVVELLDELRPGGPPDALSEMMEVDLLILDDLGGERPTEWTTERLYALINRRWLEERPVVVTTNLHLSPRSAPEGFSGPTLAEVVGDRTFSRLVGNGAVVLRLAGVDRRRG